MTIPRIWAVLPVKPFDWAKSRLEGVLAPAERAEFARRLMTGSLNALLEASCFKRVVVISRDAEALAMASKAGAHVVTEEAPADLNSAIVTVRDLAMSEGAEGLFVLASDLPLIQPLDIQTLIEAAVDRDAVISPDRRDEGTNALLLRPPDLIEPSFGVMSFSRHLALLAHAEAAVQIVRLPNVGFDVDVPGDLADLAQQA